ncbi:MAG: acetate/propionate family kinase [Phycisphaerae bacterium]|nr:acetate/propionate family kinase [Phycisphaerae bacterium]
MKILVANIGSTSFKFRLFQITGQQEQELASGLADRIGEAGGALKLQLPGQAEWSGEMGFADHGAAIRCVLDRLTKAGVIGPAGRLGAVAFKAVVGGELPDVTRVDEAVLDEMERLAPVAPAHNPPYVAAMRMFRQVPTDVPLVACFEMGFHRTNPPRRRWYAVPADWAERYGVRRYGYHGASHRYIAWRLGRLQPEARRLISCHLGGSSSLCAIRDGRSVATSMGLSPQSGLPQSNRVGDCDVYALKLMMSQTGRNFDDLLEELGTRGGLAGLSGTSGDMRDIQGAAAKGDPRAKLTLEVFVTAVRDYLGAYLVELGGTDAVVFTGGIGENNPSLRAAVCKGLQFVGIALDGAKNRSAKGEARIDSGESPVAIWVMPTNEELIVARQAAEFLAGGKA